MFITLEGIEGAGKSTQAARLAAQLRAASHTPRLTREPGGTPLAGAIRALILHPEESRRVLAAASLAVAGLAPGAAPGAAPGEDPGAEPAEPMLPLTEALLLNAARAQHVARIRDWLAGGEIVVCDRYADATRAYQGAARGLPAASVEALIALATGGLVPDLTILLDLLPAEGQRRKLAARASGGDWNRLDAEGAAFHARVRAGYLALAAAAPERWLVVDATLPPDAQAARIWDAVRARL